MRCIKLTLFLFLSSRIPPFFFSHSGPVSKICLSLAILSDPLTENRPPVHSGCQRVVALFAKTAFCAFCGPLPEIGSDSLTENRPPVHSVCQRVAALFPKSSSCALCGTSPEFSSDHLTENRPPVQSACQRVAAVFPESAATALCGPFDFFTIFRFF